MQSPQNSSKWFCLSPSCPFCEVLLSNGHLPHQHVPWKSLFCLGNFFWWAQMTCGGRPGKWDARGPQGYFGQWGPKGWFDSLCEIFLELISLSHIFPQMNYGSATIHFDMGTEARIRACQHFGIPGKLSSTQIIKCPQCLSWSYLPISSLDFFY